MEKQPILTCPVCSKQLTLKGNSLICTDNHSYDLGSSGYVNLYHNNGVNHGDDKEMLKARNHILKQGYYDGVSNKLNGLVESLVGDDNDYTIIDAGCGEGYYLSLLKNHLHSYGNIHYYGFDISKEGIKIASKRNNEINWFVANANNIPIQGKSVNCFINMFSFYNLNEIKRVLKSSGKALIFRAGNKHLIELKEIIYDTLIPKEPHFEFNDSFFNVERDNYSSKVTLRNTFDIEKILLMTPHFWKAKKEKKALLKEYENITVTFDIDIYLICQR